MKGNSLRTDKERKLERLNRRFNAYLSSKGLNNDTIKLNDIEDFMDENFRTGNKSSFYANVNYLNGILNDNNIDIKIKSRDYTDRYIHVDDELVLTKSEVKSVCNALVNYTDKFLVYMLFMGLKINEVRNIKVSDVAADYSYIKVGNKNILLDDYAKRITRLAIKQDVYYKLLNVNADLRARDYFEFNMSSPYVIKSLPSKRNGNGMNPVALTTLQRRLIKLSENFEGVARLNEESLNTSKILYDMFELHVENNVEWTIPKINEYFKINNIHKSTNEIYVKYYSRYFGSKHRALN